MAGSEVDKNLQPQSEQPAERENTRGAPIIGDDIFSRGATEEQLEALRKAVAAHKSAQVHLMEAAGVLWNSKVDAAMALGGHHGVSIAMSQRLNFFDNCSCHPCPIVVGPTEKFRSSE